MPLVSWPELLTEKTARIAARNALTRKGIDPTEGPDKVIGDEADRAEQWFDRVARGRYKPPGIVDSTHEVHEASFYVARGESRGW
jgi:hypothetical protein